MRSRLWAVPVLLCLVPAIVSASPAPQERAYGAAPLQKLDFYAAEGGKPAPLIIFVHGGGWRRGDKGNAGSAAKIEHFTGEGYAVASLNYRLVPDARVEDQAQDVADGIAWLVHNATKLGIDSSRIVLMGHSAGAHLSALVGTDPRYLKTAGIGMDRLAGVVLLDGAAYDVPAQMATGPGIMQRVYGDAFGTDPARQRALSPTLQAAPPNAPSFLILHVDRADGARQSEALAKALQANGAAVRIEGVEGQGLRGHMALNRSLGDDDFPATAIVDNWLKEVAAR